jgi:hypothetical protein
MPFSNTLPLGLRIEAAGSICFPRKIRSSSFPQVPCKSTKVNFDFLSFVLAIDDDDDDCINR